MNQAQKTYKQLEKKILTLNVKKLTAVMIIMALVIGVVSTIFWYNDVYMTNERRFWNALDNSMSTKSVVRTLVNGGSGNQVVQNNRFFFGDQTLAQSRVQFTNRSATANTTVVTEGISTLEGQFSRYSFFETDDARDDGSIPNLDAVIGQWAGETVDEAGLEEARLNYVSELVTLAVFGDFDANFRSSVIDAFQSKNVYQLDVANITETVENGETVISYPVSIVIKNYAEQLQRAFQRAGLGDFPPLNPDNYREDSRINAQFLVRSRDNTIRAINFGDRREEYSNYGVQKEIVIPTPVFTPDELESQVQQEIQG